MNLQALVGSGIEGLIWVFITFVPPNDNSFYQLLFGGNNTIDYGANGEKIMEERKVSKGGQ